MPKRLARCTQCHASIGRNVRLIAYTCSFWGRLSTEPRCFVTKMEQHYWAIQETARILWRPNIHYRLQKSLPLGPTLSHNIRSTSYYRRPLMSTLMLSSHQTLGLPKGSLLWHFLLFLISHACHMLCPSHPSLLDHPMNRCWELRNQKLVVCNYLHPSVTSCFVDPDIHLNLCSRLSVSPRNTHCLQHDKTHWQFGLSAGIRQPLAIHCDSPGSKHSPNSIRSLFLSAGCRLNPLIQICLVLVLSKTAWGRRSNRTQGKVPARFLFLVKYYQNDQIKKNEMGGACGTHGEEERLIQVFGG